MEIRFDVTIEDHKRFLAFYFIKRNWIIRLFIALLCAFWSASKETGKFDIIYLCILAVIYFVIISIVPYFISMIKMRRHLRSNPSVVGKRAMIISEDGFTAIAGDGKTSHWKWEDIRSAQIFKDYIYISIKSGYFIIPTFFFSSQDKAWDFFKPFYDHTLITKGSKRNTLRRLYYWGLLGLLPNFGAIAGIILLIKGISQFKDTKLILIGLADILFTVCFWWFFTNFTENSSFFADSNNMVVRNELNNAVKAIEFYKLQTNAYPDSLPQLKGDDSLFALYDLYSKKKDPPASYFTYYKIGNKYTIFSVGRDGKANTSDDIYPTISIPDTTKIGLIRKK